MRRRVVLACVLSSCAALAQASAAEPPADFAGFSLGLHTSYGFGASDWCFCNFVGPAIDATGGDGGVLVGPQATYGLRFGDFVLEGDARLSYASVAFADSCGPALACAGELEWLADVDLNAGVVIFGDILVAATLGYAEGDVRASTVVTAGPAIGTTREQTTTHDGLVYGAHVDLAMSGGWRYGLEYRYYDMSGTNLAADATGAPVQAEIDWHAHVAGLTIAYEF